MVATYRRAAKVDGNQAAIVKYLRKLGFSVELGHDDIIVGYQGMTFWYEIKDTNGKPTPGQKALEQNYKGHYAIVYSLSDILEDMKQQLEAVDKIWRIKSPSTIC